MKKIVIVTCFDTYIYRALLLKKSYEMLGFEVIIIQSDFMHTNKQYVKKKEKNDIYISTKSYSKNLSVARLRSHYDFSRKAFMVVSKIAPTHIHVLAPANSLIKSAGEYKKSHSQVKLYLDIIDLWPETLPIIKKIDFFPLNKWRKLRDDYIENADIVFAECDLFKKIMNDYNNKKIYTLYWAQEGFAEINRIVPPLDNLHLCYLGSINNLIDIDFIISLCKKINRRKKVILHIIGIGEKKEYFKECLLQNKIGVIDHGSIYDIKQKQGIFNMCHFGLNIMKKTVCVGLTMKSLDYFCGGLPIINNIQYDTERIVEKYNVGLNYKDNLEELCIRVLENDFNDFVNMKINICDVYNNFFNFESFSSRLKKILKEVDESEN